MKYRGRNHNARSLGKSDLTYNSWREMVSRCTNPNATSYPYYGGRGITVCEHWQGTGGYPHFLQDMGVRPSKLHSIDRIDSDQDYSPTNCKWSDKKEQQNNRRCNIRVTWEGQDITIKQWSEIVNLDYHKVYRLYKKGVTLPCIMNSLSQKNLPLQK